MSVLLAPEPRTVPDDPAESARRVPGPPPLLLWVAALVVLAGTAMVVAGALTTGITWDEPYHVMRLRNYLDHGWFALDWALTGTDGPTGERSNTLVYAPVTMLLLHGLGALLGVEGWGEVSASPAAYAVRHVGIALIGLGGTAAAAGIARILLRSWRWALMCAAALLALPMWTGHAMFNVKDVPVATGYTLTTLALVAMVAPVRGHRRLRLAGLVAGVVLMVGTRPAMWTAVVAGLGVLLLGAVVGGRFGGGWSGLVEALCGTVVAGAALVAVYPEMFGHPVATLMASAEKSASFRDGDEALWGYVPFHVLAQVPLLLLALSAVGVVSALGVVVRRWRAETSQATRLALVGAQLAAVPLFAIARHSDLYNGLRQLLFSAPVWAVLATVGLAHVLPWASRLGRPRAATLLASAALVLPVADQALAFPYQYTYYNVVLDAVGVHVPSDYWRTSVPALWDRIPGDGQIVCSPQRTPLTTETAVAGTVAHRHTSDSDSSVDCRVDQLGPLASRWEAEGRSLVEALPSDEFYALVDRGHALPANCVRLAGVVRDRHGRSIDMTYVARCTQAAPALGATGVVFARPGDGGSMSEHQWAFLPEGWVQRESDAAVDADGATAVLALDASVLCATGACELVASLDAPADLRVSLGGRSVPVSAGDGVLIVPLGTGAADVRLTLSRSSDAPLDVRLRSLRLRPLAQSWTPAPGQESA